MYKLVVCLLLSLLLIACESPSDGPIRVQYLEIWADQLNKEFEATVREWAAAENDSVVLIQVPLSDLPQRVAEFINVEGSADLAVLPSTQAVVHSDLLADMDAVVKEVVEAGHDPYPIARAMNVVGDHWVAAPLYSWSHIWVWRGDILDSLDIQPPTHLQRAPAVFRRLTDESAGRFGFGIGLGNDDDARMFFQSVLWSFGGQVFDSAGAVSLDSPQTRAALEYVLSLFRAGVLPNGVMGWDGAANNRAFLGGAIAATANAPTILYALQRQDSAMAAQLRHTLYPEGPAGRHGFATGFSLAARKDSPKLDRIRRLVSHILSREGYARLIRAGEGSVNPQYLGYEDLPMWEDPRLAVALESLNFEHPVGWPGPVTAAAAEVFDRHILTDMFSRVISDDFTVDAAVMEAHRRVEEITQRNAR